MTEDIVDADIVEFWWLVIRTPDGIWVWEFWPDGDAIDEPLVNAARVSVGYPADDAPNPDGFDIQLTLGQPHESLLVQATRGSLDDLRRIDAGTVAEHLDARAGALQQSTVDSAAAVLAQFDDATLAAVLAARRATEEVVRT